MQILYIIVASAFMTGLVKSLSINDLKKDLIDENIKKTNTLAKDLGIDDGIRSERSAFTAEDYSDVEYELKSAEDFLAYVEKKVEKPSFTTKVMNHVQTVGEFIWSAPSLFGNFVKDLFT